MRRASTVQNLLIAILLAANAGAAYAAETPFITIDLGTLPGGRDSRALAVNDSGQVVGWSNQPSGQSLAFSWTPAGGMIDLGTLGGPGSNALAVNANGQVVGESIVTLGVSNHAFSWTPAGGMIDLGALGGLGIFTQSVAFALNDAGQVVGRSTITGGSHAFSWTPAGGMIDLGTLGGTSTAAAVNANGQVVGSSKLGGNFSVSHAFSWTPA